MKRIALLFVLGMLALNLQSQQLGTIDKDGISELLKLRNDTTYVLNFWASWCSPCVAEIAYFEEAHRSYSEQALAVVLINLDFPNQIEARVLPFIKEKDLTARIYTMTDLDYNNWIPLVNSEWSGTIPATLIFNKHEEIFFEGEISKEDLFSEIDVFLNK